VKKLRALQRLFHGPEPPTHALALDAETAVNGFEGRRAWEYVKNWTSQKLVLANVGRGMDHEWRNKASCAGAGLPPLPGLPWFTDAPIFERDDFDDFHARLSSRVHRSNQLGPGASDSSFMEHASYMCFKAHVRNWTVLEANGHLEEYTARRQDERVRDGHIKAAYSFTWARGPSANRLLIFHMDRDRYWPALACGDDNNHSLHGTHISLHTTDYRGISDAQTTSYKP